MLQIAFGVFLIAHGLIHVAWLAPKPADAKGYPFDLTRSPINERLSNPIEPSLMTALGRTAATIAAISFCVAGLGVIGVPILADIWWVAAILGVVTSLDVTTMFWSPMFVAAPIIDVLVLIAAIAGWPVSR